MYVLLKLYVQFLISSLIFMGYKLEVVKTPFKKAEKVFTSKIFIV
jgi:hypothetical protein